MQTSGPELIDFRKETQRDARDVRRRAGQELLRQQLPAGAAAGGARGALRAALSHRLGPSRRSRPAARDRSCREIDQPTAALIRDLKQRGLLDNTLVIWGGEFGRTPMGEVRTSGKVGRNHHIDAYTMLMAGGGIRTGQTVGGTDEFGFTATEKIHVHDLQATILHLLGLDHTKLTFISRAGTSV